MLSLLMKVNPALHIYTVTSLITLTASGFRGLQNIHGDISYYSHQCLFLKSIRITLVALPSRHTI